MDETSTPNPPPAGDQPSWHQPPNPPRRLTRARQGRMLAGVCAGLARYFGVDPVLMRVAFLALSFAGGSGLLLYVACWIVMPEE